MLLVILLLTMIFSFVEVVSLLLLLVFLFLGFKVLETTWSYRISKPHAWERAIKNKLVPTSLLKMERFYRDRVRFYTIWLQVQRLKEKNIAGDFAELGVYKGETASFIHAMDPSRIFHLFDTFEGFAEGDLQSETIRKENKAVTFSDTSVDSVKSFIAGNANVIFHPGYFPKTAEGLDVRFAFVHLDADLYQATFAALNYFYPKVVPGGVIIVHDYNHTWDGVRKAVDAFAVTIPESLAEVADWQGSIMIIRNRI